MTLDTPILFQWRSRWYPSGVHAKNRHT